ncbi:hypothetical protein BCR33DRAFT_550505 [Rhizoclosmatium globosum]|uniref:Adenylyl cyclase n=1 Tax=Rhizoclosmatium globosum TaxID=329046 RepID=A0A1Y2B8T8_9FUNG|nr:hypothetical protein BCR33DRAFT_550505 [Rhizoclosmatium globosum]|eukprot:ORY31164.1 hypothetical protein BCR33DRAFT_550505 [Rhizoclosmatium globosum]
MASSSEDTSLLCFIPQHIRDLISRSDAQEPPWVDISEFGITAIIDISGYSKLTSHLQSFYGNDGGAKVKELLNPPIIEIIKRVKDGFGSVVKFSGDAIIASWTSKDSLTLIEKELLTTRALLCCLELTSFFSDYNIMVPVQKELMSSFSISPALPSPKTGPMTLNRMSVTVGRVMSSHSTNKKGSVDGVTEQETRKPQQLKIHIGLGFGKTSHIHVGERYDVDDTTSDPRMEYFIAGESMKNAAEFLSIGTEGDIVFSSELISFHGFQDVKHFSTMELRE